MVCEDCHGERWVRINRTASITEDEGWTPHLLMNEMPCPSCNGSGSMSCCEGAVGKAGDVGNQGESHE